MRPPKTLDEALERARSIRREWTEAPLAVWIVETFGEEQPCGQISPEVYPGEVIITREMVGTYTPEAAIVIAIDIIRSAQLAKEQTK